MPRKARAVAAGYPHHVTQRGNNRQQVFFAERDRSLYLKLVFGYAERYETEVWGYCLMNNHVHWLVVPQREDSLARTFGRSHCDYARYANLVTSGAGHLWQARYFSCAVEEAEAWNVLAYIERNPVRAELVKDAWQWPWSSANAHLRGHDPSGRLSTETWRTWYTPDRWKEVLGSSIREEALKERLREATNSGLPYGSGEFSERLGKQLGRDLEHRPRGRPRKDEKGVNGDCP